MRQPLILVVGNSFSNLKTALIEQGLDFVVLKDKHLTKFPDKRFKRRVVCDFADKNLSNFQP